MASTASIRDERRPPLGVLLREWRGARRMSQLDLALEADLSARHLGFIETGRSQPSRDTVARLADALRVPLRERNALLLAAGYAAHHPESALATSALEHMREAIDLIERAIETRCVLTLDYRDEAGRSSMRDARPLGLWFWGKVWTLIAWCELRDDFRAFRIDRIASVVAPGRTFKPERGKQLADFYRRAEMNENMGPTTARAFPTAS